LLLAPQSGEETRSLIKDKSIELRDKATDSAGKARVRVDEFTTEAKSRGKEFVDSAKKAVTKKRPTEPAAE
jgi:gas vesicle protein